MVAVGFCGCRSGVIVRHADKANKFGIMRIFIGLQDGDRYTPMASGLNLC